MQARYKMEKRKESAWNEFQRQKKEKEGQDRQATYDLTNIREEYNKNISKAAEEEDMVKKSEHRDTIRCSPRQFNKDLHTLDEPRKSLLKGWVADSPFVSLWEMDKGIQSKSLIVYLLKQFDVHNRSIKINGVEHKMTPEDVTNIMGIMDGGKEFSFTMNDSDENSSEESFDTSFDQLFERFVEYEKGGAKAPFISRTKVINVLTTGSQVDAKRAYDLLALIRIVAPSSRDKMKVMYLKVIDDFGNMNWATHILKDIVSNISTWQNGHDKAVQSAVGGCALFLQVSLIIFDVSVL